VNLAARLESANKQLGTSTLIDDTTLKQAEDDISCMPIGPTVVVGQTTPVTLHAIIRNEFSESDSAIARRLLDAIEIGDRNAARTALEAMGDCPALDTLAVLWAEVIDADQDLFLRLTSK